MTGKRPSVLIVDDEPDFVRGLSRLVRLDGYDVESVGTIQELLGRQDLSRFLVILLDHKLPDGTGEDALPRLREIAPDATVIIITGHSDLPATIAAFRAGVHDYLLKPVDPDVLRDRLRRLQEAAQARQALTEARRNQQRVEQKSLDRELRLAAILNTANDAIITIDRRGIITGINPATERIFGYIDAELVGQNVKVLMPPPHCDEHDAYIARYVETGQARILGIGREVMARRKDGSMFPVDLAVSEVQELGLFTGIVRDISIRKRLESEILEIASAEQQRIGQELHDGVAGELTGLGILADTLATALARKSQLPLEQNLAAQLRQGLKQAITQIRALAYGLVPVELTSYGLMDSLRALAARVRSVNGVDCSFDCPDEIRIDDNQKATHLFRIAQEAVANALRHGKPQSVQIILEKMDHHGILRIRDDGQGFDVPDTGQQQTSLGLRSMQYRASQIGARLTVESTPGSGTLVTCVVPLDDASP